MKNITTLGAVKLLGVACIAVILSACSSTPEKSEWGEKTASPWATGGSIKSGRDAYEESLATDQADAVAGDQLAYDPYAPAPAEPVQAMEPVVEEAPVAAEPAPAAMGAEQEIMNQPANYYTLQLMASVDIDRVYKFAEQNQLSVRYVVPTMRDGVTWHVLLLDIYPDLASAKLARDEMSGVLKTSPWIRTLGSIQKLMQ
ncbi:MAG: hypothetical protein OQK76_04780 [Gammaproteobacteria bacterium]|nr:hypothetical protein [Gammaproteobacteria bacterium]MCW8909917.1 hypothetical protein [Gammaproteobacteria bacterium]MCW9055167.1 hypothetical protein [Gammaproteobacteria bacterium]